MKDLEMNVRNGVKALPGENWHHWPKLKTQRRGTQSSGAKKARHGETVNFPKSTYTLNANSIKTLPVLKVQYWPKDKENQPMV